MTASPLNDRWTARLKQRRRISTLYPEFAVVESAAETRLRIDEDTLSIWLFGSRAKGTARSDSDWDVALIRSSYVDAQRTRMEHASTLQCNRANMEINCVQIPIDVFLDKRLAFPHLAWAVAGEGIPLAQRQWRLPIHQKNEAFSIDFLEYHRHLAQTRDRVRGISICYEVLADTGSLDLWDAMCDRLQDETQKMAEGFIKAGCIQRGYEKFPKVHDFNELAQSVRDEVGDEDFATTIDSLNGNSTDDNLIRYLPVQDPAGVTGAIDRLCNLCDAFARELSRHASEFRTANENEALSDLHNLASSTAREMSRAQKILSGLSKVTSTPDSVNENSSARVLHAWEGIDAIQEAMIRAELDIRYHFDI